jgi:hypothetical protein
MPYKIIGIIKFPYKLLHRGFKINNYATAIALTTTPAGRTT